MSEKSHLLITPDEVAFDPESLGLGGADDIEEVRFHEDLHEQNYRETRSIVGQALQKGINRVLGQVGSEEGMDKALDLIRSDGFANWMSQLLVNHVLDRHTDLVFFYSDYLKAEKLEEFLEEEGIEYERTGPDTVTISGPDNEADISRLIDEFYSQLDEDSLVSVEKMED